MTQRVWRHTVAALMAAVLCVVLVASAAPVTAAAAAATAPTGDAAASSRYAPPPVPAFERFFAQQFRVSVMTQSYGVFNATLHMRGSMNFPERVHGELIPLGEPRLDRHTQTRLPHFSRARGVEDDKLSDLPFTMTGGKQPAGKAGSSREFAAASGEEERPSLLVVDLQLVHSDATRGKAQVYYLPAELMALRSQREAIGEGSTAPSASADFSFRLEAAHMSENPLSDSAALARVSTAAVTTGAAASAARGDVVFRWISEHEFSATLSLPIATGEERDQAPTHVEHIWVHGYVPPTKGLFDRKDHQIPWYNRYLMLGVGLMGFVVQIISGWAEGKNKAVKRAEVEDTEKEKLEAAMRDQERINKKKK